jgi:bacterial leucyl aminopeptidase
MSTMKAFVTVLAVLSGASLARAQPQIPPAATGSTIWIATGSDVAGVAQSAFAGRAALADGRPVFRTFATNNGIAVAEIAENALNDLMALVHENFRRCGGFTVHSSYEAALGEANNPAYAPGFRTAPGIFPVTIDQQAAVRPALDLVSGSEIVGTITALQNLGTRYYQSQKGQDAADLIHARWQSLGAGRTDFSVSRFTHTWLQNSVLATIRGSELPDEIVVIGGHLDSINQQNTNNAPGADDDASGIAVVTEALRVMMRTGFKPKRTIQFMAYAAEEVGLRGSGEIADRYKREGKNVIAALQMDMTGFRGSEKDVYLVNDFVSADLNAFLKKLMDEYNRSGAHQITHGETACGYACSDHSSWTRNGVPAAFPFESAFADYNRAIHSPNDTIANLDASGTHQARFAKLGLEFLIETAKAAGAAPPPRAVSRYLYTTLRIISDQAPRGCRSGDWTCMSQLCRQDLGASAWRGWAGCWAEGAKFQCNFECGAARELQ